MNKIPVKELKECFEYNHNGHLIWKQRPMSHFLTLHGRKVFNGKFAGLRVATSRSHKGEKTTVGIPVTIRGVRVAIPLHHIVWALKYNKLPKYRLKHIDGDKWNNKVENLEEGEAPRKTRKKKSIGDQGEIRT